MATSHPLFLHQTLETHQCSVIRVQHYLSQTGDHTAQICSLFLCNQSITIKNIRGYNLKVTKIDPSRFKSTLFFKGEVQKNRWSNPKLTLLANMSDCSNNQNNVLKYSLNIVDLPVTRTFVLSLSIHSTTSTALWRHCLLRTLITVC